MKRSHKLAGAALTCAAVALVVVAAQPPRADRWKKVDEAVNKGLPKTAITELDPIIESALKDKAYPEAIKAIAKKISLEGTIEGNKPEEKITRMQAAIATAPAEMHPVMNAILAHWYWHYFQQNRWRFTQRTATGEAPGTDIQTWDLARIFAEIDKTFDKALANEKELEATPVARYDILLTKGGIPDTFRPTLFDFLAFDALNFYASAEQAGAKPQDNYELDANSPVFGSVAEFLKWQPKTTDANNKTVKGVALYQKLLAFHKGDADKSALLDADLHRLRFGLEQGRRRGEERALQDGAGSVREGQRRARTVRDGAVPTRRRASGRRRLGEGARGRDCRHARLPGQPPAARSASTSCSRSKASRAAPPPSASGADPLPTIKVTYKNVTKAYFRVVAVDYVERMKANRWRPEQLNHDEAKALLNQKPVLEFSHDLPATPDYKTRTEIIPGRGGLKPGFYYLLVSHDPDFGSANNVVNYTDFWVSDLAIVDRHDYGKLEAAGMVTDNRTGAPVEGAKVQVWTRDNNGGWNAGATATTRRERAVRGRVQRPPHAHGPRHAQRATAFERRRVVHLPQQQPRTDARTNGVLHRPRAVPPRPDDQLQGHRAPLQPRHRHLRDDLEPRCGRDLHRRERQGDRPPADKEQRLRLVQRQLHRAARPAHGPHVDPHRPRRHERHRRGVQAAQVQGGGGGAEIRVQARRHREGAGEGHTVQRRAGRRREGDVPRRARGPLPGLVLLVLLVAAGAAQAGTGDRARRGDEPNRTAVSPSRSSRCRT